MWEWKKAIKPSICNSILTRIYMVLCKIWLFLFDCRRHRIYALQKEGDTIELRQLWRCYAKAPAVHADKIHDSCTVIETATNTGAVTRTTNTFKMSRKQVRCRSAKAIDSDKTGSHWFHVTTTQVHEKPWQHLFTCTRIWCSCDTNIVLSAWIQHVFNAVSCTVNLYKVY